MALNKNSKLYKDLYLSMKTQTDPELQKDGAPILYVGDPGVGKTAILKEFCEMINHHVEVIILGRLPSIDIGGMHVPDLEKGTLTHLISPRLLGEVDQEDGTEGVCIFLDEIGNTMEDQQTAIQSLLQDRSIDGKKMRDNVWFVMATNPSGSNCGSNEIIKSLKDRLCTVPILSEFSTSSPSMDAVEGTYISVQKDLFPMWLEECESLKINDLVEAYNRYKEGESFHKFDHGSEDESQPSPRSWRKLSNLLNTGADLSELQRLGPACVGRGEWAEFWGWTQVRDQVTTFSEILNDPDDCKVPSVTQPSHQYAVVMNIARGVKNMGDDISGEHIDSILSFLRRLPETFAAYGWKVAKKNNPEFTERSKNTSQFIADYADSIR